MNKAKEKALEYIKSKIPFSAGFHKGDMEDVIIKGIDIAIEEKAKEIFDDIEKTIFPLEVNFEDREIITLTEIVQLHLNKLKKKHLNTSNTDSKNEGDKNQNDK